MTEKYILHRPRLVGLFFHFIHFCDQTWYTLIRGPLVRAFKRTESWVQIDKVHVLDLHEALSTLLLWGIY